MSKLHLHMKLWYESFSQEYIVFNNRYYLSLVKIYIPVFGVYKITIFRIAKTVKCYYRSKSSIKLIVINKNTVLAVTTSDFVICLN